MPAAATAKGRQARPGFGQGPGNGARPEAKTNGTFFDSRVPQTVGKGAAQITGLTGGPNLKNQAEAEIQKAATEIEHGSTDPLSGHACPRSRANTLGSISIAFGKGSRTRKHEFYNTVQGLVTWSPPGRS